jgi:hypothetical protein
VHGAGQVDNGASGRADFTVNDADEPNCQNNNTPAVTAHDAQRGHTFTSTKTLSLTFNPGQAMATITGSGVDNGVPVTFTAVAVDSSVAGRGSFTLSLSDGYVIGGRLLSGSITVTTPRPG